LFVFSFAAGLQAETREAKAKVRAVRGTAQVSINGGAWAPLKANTTLKAGAIIRTASESYVDLFLNNSVVRVTPDTMMGIDKLLSNNTGVETAMETQLNLKSGRILGNVKKLAAASKYEIKTPNGVAGIRGTDFDITVVPLGGGKFRLTITSLTGTIIGAAVNNQNVLVNAVINTVASWDPDGNIVELVPLEVLRAAQQLLRDAIEGRGGPGQEYKLMIQERIAPDAGSVTNSGFAPN